MVAADTSRTLHYIDALIRNDLRPAFVFLLVNDSSELRPGQKDFQTKETAANFLEWYGDTL